MSKKVFLVRHGQSVGNVDGIFHGPEVPLTELGHDQARFIAERCRHIDHDVILASTMERARRTALYIHELTGKPIEFHDDLVERIQPSSITDKSVEDPAIRALSERWTETFFTYGEQVEDGENFELLRDRTIRTLDHFKNRPEQRMIVVTHGFKLRMDAAVAVHGKELTPEIFKNFLTGFTTTNTGMTVLQTPSPHNIWSPWSKDRDWVIKSWNDYAHLGVRHSHE